MTNAIEDHRRIARATGGALLATIAIGIAASLLVTGGININLNADADNMMSAGSRVYAKAYIAAGLALVDLFAAVGLYLLLRNSGSLLALWCLVAALAAAGLDLAGALDTLQIANLLGSERLAAVAPGVELRALLVGLVTSDYTAFHLRLVISAAAKAGFFWLFVRSRLVPLPIAWWGVAASLYVVVAIVGRDFIDALGHGAVTMSFILGNLVAHLALGLYLAIKGVRAPA